MNDYTGSDLMAAILEVRDATASGFANLEARLSGNVDSLRHDMNRRFDRLEDRVAAIEPRGHRPAS